MESATDCRAAGPCHYLCPSRRCRVSGRCRDYHASRTENDCHRHCDGRRRTRPFAPEGSDGGLAVQRSISRRSHYENPFMLGVETVGTVVSTVTKVGREVLTLPTLSMAAATIWYGPSGANGTPDVTE